MEVGDVDLKESLYSRVGFAIFRVHPRTASPSPEIFRVLCTMNGARIIALRTTSVTESNFLIRLWQFRSLPSTSGIVRPRSGVRRLSQWSVDSVTGVISSQGTPHFQTLIGLEVHAQLDVSTKLFSGCPVASSSSSSKFHQKPNTLVWPLDVGVPGVLPRLSQEAVQKAILAAAATKCELPPVSRFERKHYFYADSPLGYQVTQQRWPLAREGRLECRRSSGNQKKRKQKADAVDDNIFTTRIERIQLEQDTGKTIVMTNPATKRKESLVDFNRAGMALIEIVFYPDLRSSTEASTAVETLRLLLKHIGACDGKMEEGSLRCDLNVSIAPYLTVDGATTDGQDILKRAGNRVEVKNLNSIRQVQQAAEYEALRQAQAAMDGIPTQQETRTFDVQTGKTVTIRTKEGAKDYRFMPEPDLPPLILNEQVFGDDMDLDAFLASELPELPEDARQRLQNDYGLSEYTAGVLTGDPPAIAMFGVAVQAATNQLESSMNNYDRAKEQVPRTVANLLCNELFALVREFEMQRLIEEGNLEQSGDSSVQYSKVTGTQLGEVVGLLIEGTISNTMAKQLLKVLYEESLQATAPSSSSLSPRQLAQERGFQVITDPQELAELCRAAIESSPEEMDRYKQGDKYAKKITKFLLGKAMSANSNAHPERLNEIMSEVLQEVAPMPENP